jgi:hypothetical protein
MYFASSVTIGPRFFAKAFNDYADRYWAFAREILQNSIDCGSATIDVHVVEEWIKRTTSVVVENDGEPMSSDVLTGKLLSLGESGKDFGAGAVGGFGKAKEILYFAHVGYVITTGGLQVEGSGAGYNLTEAPVPCDGTRSTVAWDGLNVEALKSAFRRFIELCNRPNVAFFLNGERVRGRHAAGDPVRTLDHDGQPWAEVRLSKAEKNLLVVRIGGVPMFQAHCDYKGTVILDLLGTSGSKLTSNRDGLKYPYSDQLRQFITTIAIDRRTAFVLEKAEYTRFEGDKLRTAKDQAPAAGPPSWLVAARADQPEAMGGAGIQVQVLDRAEAPGPRNRLGHEFILKNTVRRPVPDAYNPGSESFGDYAKWLARAWAGCLLELHDLLGVEEPFSVGFLFSEDIEAEYEKSPERGKVYYCSPCKVSRKGHSRRYTKADRFEVLASAAHEFVHGALGESYHGEDYASKLTDVMALVMKHRNRFTRHLA